MITSKEIINIKIIISDEINKNGSKHRSIKILVSFDNVFKYFDEFF